MASRPMWNIPGSGIELSPWVGRWILIHCATREVNWSHNSVHIGQCLFMVVLLFPSYFMFIAYCKTIVSCISLYFCMIWSGFYSFHVFPHIFGYCDYNFHFIISLDLAFIGSTYFSSIVLKKKSIFLWQILVYQDGLCHPSHKHET